MPVLVRFSAASCWFWFLFRFCLRHLNQFLVPVGEHCPNGWPPYAVGGSRSRSLRGSRNEIRWRFRALVRSNTQSDAGLRSPLNLSLLFMLLLRIRQIWLRFFFFLDRNLNFSELRGAVIIKTFLVLMGHPRERLLYTHRIWAPKTHLQFFLLSWSILFVCYAI
jgi:hypothetical protein